MTNIQVSSSAGICVMPIEARLMANRKVFIEGEINQESACDFMKKILFLNREDTNRPIDVLINSPGGEIDAGMLMYDVIQGSRAPIRLYCTGEAFSMAAVILAGGEHGRYILPHSRVMLHEPRLLDGVSGSASSVQSVSENLLETKRKMNRILAGHTGKSEEEIEEAARYDHFFSARESVDFGLADEVVGFERLTAD